MPQAFKSQHNTQELSCLVIILHTIGLKLFIEAVLYKK